MFKEITLEMSLKPFIRTDSEFIKTVVGRVYEQWQPFIKGREVINIMLWTSDGSEILDYAARLDDAFAWGCYLGMANVPLADETDRPDTSLFKKSRFYTDKPAVMTYRILKEIVDTLKAEGKRRFPGAQIRVGNTFDIGPEFAPSDFKYHRHREIVAPGQKKSEVMTVENMSVDSTALLCGDDRRYAAYPDGIPDKTPFALFLGKQTECFCRDLGFDFLWLSNGVGFSSNPWELNGKIFDGKNFHIDRLGKTKKAVFGFWKNFRAGCPALPVMTRGTNNTVGIDYATDGVPIYDIYGGGFDILPPPNSPWAALNDNFGLELMGHMTRICELPENNKYLFRYYIHDPWWVNSPWFDRYDRNPHDIYLPMAISRVDELGRQHSADVCNILSIDNSYGKLPDFCVNETLPHLLRAESEAPDAMAPFVLVYPMREYSRAQDEETLRRMYYGDRYVCDSINDGFPLNCVVSSDNFMKHSPDLYRHSVLVSPIPESEELSARLAEIASSGGKVIIYGDGKAGLHEACGNICFAEVGGELLRAVAGRLGYVLDYGDVCEGRKNLTYTVHRHRNGFWFSLYNCNTTASFRFDTPLGAPILLTGECTLDESGAKYRFARSDRRECRVFIKQKRGLVSAKERPSGNPMFERIFTLEGLDDAEVCYFPIHTDAAYVGRLVDHTKTPEYITPDGRFDLGEGGVYYKFCHLSGSISFYTERK